jgi:methionyl-tRNA formyltransferase
MNEGAVLLVKTVEGLISNTIVAQPQAVQGVLHHAPKIFKEDGLIDFNQNALAIHNLIRGLSPIPTAYTYIKEKLLKIYRSQYEIVVHQQVAGSIDTDGKNYVKFATNDGWLYALEVQLEGKKRMAVADFLMGYKF